VSAFAAAVPSGLRERLAVRVIELLRGGPCTPPQSFGSPRLFSKDEECRESARGDRNWTATVRESVRVSLRPFPLASAGRSRACSRRSTRSIGSGARVAPLSLGRQRSLRAKRPVTRAELKARTDQRPPRASAWRQLARRFTILETIASSSPAAASTSAPVADIFRTFTGAEKPSPCMMAARKRFVRATASASAARSSPASGFVELVSCPHSIRFPVELGDRIAFPLSSSKGDSGAGLWPCYSLLRNGSIGRTRPAIGCG